MSKDSAARKGRYELGIISSSSLSHAGGLQAAALLVVGWKGRGHLASSIEVRGGHLEGQNKQESGGILSCPCSFHFYQISMDG